MVQKVKPQSSEIRAGEHVLLRCEFSRSHPAEVRFFWKKNGNLVQEGKELSFSPISPEDSGNYNCLVNNSIGETPSQSWYLRVLCEWLELGATCDEDEVTGSPGLTRFPLHRCPSEAARVY